MNDRLKQRAQREVLRTDLLDLWMEASKKHFDWIIDRYPRVFEYTWLLEQLEGEQGVVCDVGAGVSPLPIILAEWGNIVYTVDRQDPQDKNGWGFIDYSQFHDNIKSFNCDFAQFDEAQDFDFIYSISAIEHMTAANRRKVIKTAAGLLKDSGIFYATVDLKRGTQLIYNRNNGLYIEDNHGTIDQVFNEFEQHFSDITFARQDGIKGVGIELLYITAIK